MAGTPIRDIQAMLRHKHIGTTLLYIEDVPDLRWLAQRRMETLAGYGELGAAGIRSLEPWQGGLAAHLREIPAESETQDRDPRLQASELAA